MKEDIIVDNIFITTNITDIGKKKKQYNLNVQS